MLLEGCQLHISPSGADDDEKKEEGEGERTINIQIQSISSGPLCVLLAEMQER